jgi:hypothetical protein
MTMFVITRQRKDGNSVFTTESKADAEQMWAYWQAQGNAHLHWRVLQDLPAPQEEQVTP